MDRDNAPGQYGVAIVSCDILGHSSAAFPDQVDRVAAINEIVGYAIRSSPEGDVVWASGGDGGHVAFRQESWQQPALSLILSLYRWSVAHGVGLRITAHHGQVTDIEGADGRVQLVGVGINYAGRLLSQVSREGVVVTDAFRRGIEVVDVTPAVAFRDSRSIPTLGFEPQLLFLMSCDGIRSAWVDPVPGDQAALAFAVDNDKSWDVLYYCKRIWEVNSAAPEAERAMRNVKSHRLAYRSGRGHSEEINPFLGNLQPDEMQEILRLGQLVERRRGEVICRYEDAGNTMFVVLRGQVGVFNSEGKGFDGAAEAKHVHSQGEIVGELAYALSRNRTADLTALTDVALLSFTNETLRNSLSKTQVGESVGRRVSSFINYRVLQHVSDNAPYLLGPRRTGPLAAGGTSWNEALLGLQRTCELVDVDTRALDLTLDRVPLRGAEPHGLCILVAGTLREHDSGTLLDGAEFPVLWVDIPNLVSLPSSIYHVQEEPVKILRIGAAGIDGLTPPKRIALRDALPRALRRRTGEYEFDVFLCHSKRDWPVVSRIHERLTDAGITCWLDDDRLAPGARVTEAIETGLRSSKFLLACVSENFAQSEWAKLELQASLHLDVKRRDRDSVILLMLDGEYSKDDVVPLLARDTRRVRYTRGTEFERLIDYLVREGPA